MLTCLPGQLYETKRQASGNKKIILLVQSEIKPEIGFHPTDVINSKNPPQLETEISQTVLFPSLAPPCYKGLRRSQFNRDRHLGKEKKNTSFYLKPHFIKLKEFVSRFTELIP